jgi:hypothetical protein
MSCKEPTGDFAKLGSNDFNRLGEKWYLASWSSLNAKGLQK